MNKLQTYLNKSSSSFFKVDSIINLTLPGKKMMMINSPQNPTLQEKETNDFRAPPPSPIGSSRRASSVTNDEVLTEFLEQSLRVPDLILPNRIFPKQKSFKEIPLVNFKLLNCKGYDSIEKTQTQIQIRTSLSEIGCFQLINHGISPDLIRKVVRRAGRIFIMSPEKKRMVGRSLDMEFGFEEIGGEQEEVVSEISEEFVWGMSHDFKLKMEGIWPSKFSKFSDKMESLASSIEKIGQEIMLILKDEEYSNDNVIRSGCVCHIYKHPHGVSSDQCISTLRYDVIRMMIKGSDYSHALSLHICDGSSEFHVYSKKGWISFTPLESAFIVTVGDKLQAWSGGRYKQVIGKPIYISKRKDCISLAFLYSPPSTASIESTAVQYKDKKEKIISLRQQALFAIVLTIACQFVFHIYSRVSHDSHP